MRFDYRYEGAASRLMTGGEIEYEKDSWRWKATIIAQTNPEIKFEAWDEDPAVAGLKCCAAWMGRELR